MKTHYNGITEFTKFTECFMGKGPAHGVPGYQRKDPADGVIGGYQCTVARRSTGTKNFDAIIL